MNESILKCCFNVFSIVQTYVLKVENSFDQLRVREILSGPALDAASMASASFDSSTKALSLDQSSR